MNFEEFAAKPLLSSAGIDVPESRLAATADEAGIVAEGLCPVVVKAQVPTGKRGKAGGIKRAETPAEAASAAGQILGMDIAGHRVERVLVEQCADIAREFYCAVLNDSGTRGPMAVFSTLGGMDVEEAAEQAPDQMRRLPIDIRHGLDAASAEAMLAGLDLGGLTPGVAEFLVRLFGVYREYDAELVEINPLAVTGDGRLVALDCKFVMDDSGLPRHDDIAASGTPDKLTHLEQRGKDLGLKYIELSGGVGVLANGAGLTMTTMDVVKHCGGQPANFLEIGGEAYTKAKPALELVLANPQVKSLVINFCGAFARCDVMVDGIINAWEELKPTLPVFFSVHGTGEEEAVAMLKDRLGITPYDTMEEASLAAVEAAK